MKVIKKIFYTSTFVTAFVFLGGCGSDGIGGTGIRLDDAPTIAAQGKLIRSNEAALSTYFKDSIKRSNITGGDDVEAVNGDFSVNAPSLDGSGDSPQVSSTNIQEQGVDEADLIKTDGRYVYSVSKPARVFGGVTDTPTIDNPDNLPNSSSLAPDNSIDTSDEIRIIDTQGATGFVEVKYFSDDENKWNISGLYLHQGENRLVALSSRRQDVYANWFDSRFFANQNTELVLMDVSAPANASIETTINFDGQLIDSRRNGDTLYMVLRHFPDYQYVNDTELEGTSTDDFLPTFSKGNGSRELLAKAQDCYVEEGQKGSRDIITLVAVDLTSANPAIKSQCYVGNVEAIYASTQSLYLATTRWNYQVNNGIADYAETKVTTDIHKFAYEGLDFDYRGSGEVDGHLGFRQSSKSFRFSESQDELRVITFDEDIWQVLELPIIVDDGIVPTENGEGTDDAVSVSPTDIKSPVVLSILKEDTAAKSLKLISKLPNKAHPEPIGLPGERLYATRFIGDRAYVVTFRITDPLYILDLSNSSEPFIAGELKIDGYSEILQPITDTLLLGVGKDAVPSQGGIFGGDGRGAFYQGIKLSLIDVSDAANPREVDKVIIGKRGSESTALNTHHGLTTLKVGDDYRVALPVRLHEDASPIFDGGDSVSHFHQFKQLGLYRYEIDVNTQKINQLPAMIIDKSSDNFPQIENDRSVLINNEVYYMHNGKFWLQDWQGNDAIIGPK
ncbi:MAG: beta-propeller domain-containing protein [Cocleimonas sp.]